MSERTAQRCTCLMVAVVGFLRPPAAAEAAEIGDLRATFYRAATEFDEAQQQSAVHPEAARKLFRSAAQRFESLVSVGVVNGRLEFNLGNCYLQTGDVGKAILHYRRAMRLIPGDVMLAENLSVARSRCLTHIPPTRRSTVLGSLFFWHFQTAVAGRTRVAIILYALFWTAMIVRNFLRSRGVSVLAFGLAFTCTASAASVAVDRWADRNATEGVVTGMDVPVYKGPGVGYQRQFEQPLQPGVEFTVRERTAGGWWRIELPDGKTGWIEASRGELIPTERSSLFLDLGPPTAAIPANPPVGEH